MKSSLLFRVELRRLRVLVSTWLTVCPRFDPCILKHLCIGEAGEVEESMRELAAVEALKVEKAEKEVRFPL